jgi:hypothetical protein
MTRIGFAIAALALPVVLAAACGRGTPPETPLLEQEPASGSVEGRFAEINVGTFDLVDGIAWPAEGRGTVIYVTSKPIASSTLTRSACPATMARALTAVRDAGWVEVTLDASGTSHYFGSGTPYGGSMRALDPPGRYWTSTLTASGDRVSGRVRHTDYGRFAFDLPLSTPRVKEVSENDRMQGLQADPSAPSPSSPAMIDAYRAAHTAALAKDWNALLAAMGFDTAQVSAIRALGGIDADLQAFANRFLTPGDPGETEIRAGHGYVRGEGANRQGAAFINYYWFAPCRATLVLYSVSENPQ